MPFGINVLIRFINSTNGLSPGQGQAIIWNDADLYKFNISDIVNHTIRNKLDEMWSKIQWN